MTAELQIELVYDSDCPNADTARTAIREALTALGVPLHWSEWESTSTEIPPSLRGFGSPTVLVNGRDVSAEPEGLDQRDARSCRIYRDSLGRQSGAPSSQLIVRALQAAGHTDKDQRKQ